MFRVIIGSILGLVLAIAALLTSMMFRGDEPLQQAEATVNAMADRTAPSANNNPMDPVVVEEAARRAALHQRVGETKQEEQGDTVGYVAPPVVTEIRSAGGVDELTQALFGDDFIVTPPAIVSEPEPEPEPVVEEVEPEPEPEPEPVIEVVEAEPEPEPTISSQWLDYYRNRSEPVIDPASEFGVKPLEDPLDMPMEQSSLGDYMSDPRFLERAQARNATIDDQYLFVQVAEKFGDTVFADPIVRPRYAPVTEGFSAPTLNERSAARPPMVAVGPNGEVFTTSPQPNPYATANSGPVVLVRSGDLLYASLLYGFDNTDVRGLPIYATITDYLPNGTQGPLDGARIRGEVRYSREDASIVFTQAILPNGLEIPINAVAVSNEDGRTGVAQNVNRHVISRYGSLFLAGIISGVSEVGLSRLSNSDSQIIINNGSGDVNGSDEPTEGEILAGSLAPIGRNLSGIARDNFNRDFTITAEAGMGFSLVFLRTLVTDPSDVTGRAFNPRTGQYEAVRLNNDIPESGGQAQQGTAIPPAVQNAVTGSGN